MSTVGAVTHDSNAHHGSGEEPTYVGVQRAGSPGGGTEIFLASMPSPLRGPATLSRLKVVIDSWTVSAPDPTKSEARTRRLGTRKPHTLHGGFVFPGAERTGPKSRPGNRVLTISASHLGVRESL